MSRNEKDRLQDIKDAIATIRRHLATMEDQPTDTDSSLIHDALLFQFVVIGEAVKHLAPDTRETAAEIPWADVASLRDLITHEYFRIDIDRILEIIESDLSKLEQAVGRLLDE